MVLFSKDITDVQMKEMVKQAVCFAKSIYPHTWSELEKLEKEELRNMKKQSSKESTSHLFNRYVWLVDTIYRAERITFEAINEKWSHSELNDSGEDIPLRTFHNHRKAIEQMFDINIECDKRSGYAYYIENSEDMERGGVRSWLLNTFAVNNLINESHKLKHRILFENIPSGQRFLTLIIEAMRDGKTVELTYQSYWHSEPHTFEVEPYCVKVFRQRWYLVAYSPYKNRIMIYALDRVKWLLPTDQSFVLPKDFDPEAYFYNSFGIINDENIKPEEVRIKVYTDENKHLYIQSLPMHHSQEIVKQTEDHTIFRYYIRPTYDFRQEILSHGADIEILSPKWFRDGIASIIKDSVKLYE